MATVLHNVVIHPPAARRPAESAFRIISRTDGKTGAPPRPERPAAPDRSGPKRCPLCGTSVAGRLGLFRMIEGTFECTECRTRFDETGTIVAICVTE